MFNITIRFPGGEYNLPSANVELMSREDEAGKRDSPRPSTKPQHQSKLNTGVCDDSSSRLVNIALHQSLRAIPVLVLVILVSQPALAQTAGSDFCSTDMAETIRNMFNLIQFGGPLIGGVVALGAAVATPYVRRADTKEELKGIRNGAVIWGVIVAPLAAVIIGFLLNNVVVGGTSCGF